jgi:two-component system LytT family response regulator
MNTLQQAINEDDSLMNKIKTLLIDDDQFIVKILSDLIQENHPEIEILGIAKSGKEGLRKIEVLKPDLIFLDIEMPDMNGFEMLNNLKVRNFKTIFTTAHSKYAIKAFRFNALDYLLKPIIESELLQAIRRFQKNHKENQEKQIQNALHNLTTNSNKDQRLALETQNGLFSLPLKEIVFIEGDRNYSVIHQMDGAKEVTSKTLGYFEELLAEDGFFRSHRSYLVNSIFINEIRSEEFVLLNEINIPISRRRKSLAIKWFTEI